ncbi:hypothetical protein AC579_1876 [Pseudocercospora musae]|uniref:Uncharacterized protein n=1 Tax=Pseudocercospora musae TaxID=113226 RepID=A0A139IBI6_9PEZI|nr:hypothetical protein AC579_1876 [Pseudocercospora musae]
MALAGMNPKEAAALDSVRSVLLPRGWAKDQIIYAEGSSIERRLQVLQEGQADLKRRFERVDGSKEDESGEVGKLKKKSKAVDVKVEKVSVKVEQT